MKMTTRITSRAVTFAAVLLGCVGAAGQSTEPTDRIRQLEQEVQSLRWELQVLEADVAAERLAAMDQELRAIRARRQLLEQDDLRIQRRIESVQRLRASATLSPVEHREAYEEDASRELKPGSELIRIRDEQRQLAERDAALSRQIAIRLSRWQALQQIDGNHRAAAILF